MAKRGRTNTGEPLPGRKGEPKAKSFWATFFATLPDDPDAVELFDEDWALSDEDEADAPDEETLVALLDDEGDELPRVLDDEVEQITWEDGEPVVTTVPLTGETFGEQIAPPTLPLPGGYVPLRSAFADDDETEEAAYALLASSFAAHAADEAETTETAEEAQAPQADAAEASDAEVPEVEAAAGNAADAETEAPATEAPEEPAEEARLEAQPSDEDRPPWEDAPTVTTLPDEAAQIADADEPAEEPKPVETDAPDETEEQAEADAPEETGEQGAEERPASEDAAAPKQPPCIPLSAPYAPLGAEEAPVERLPIESFIPAALRTNAPLPPTYVPLGGVPVEPVIATEAPEQPVAPLPPTYVPLGGAPVESVITTEEPEQTIAPLPPTYVPLGGAPAEPVIATDAPEQPVAPLPPTYVPLGGAPVESAATIEATYAPTRTAEESAPMPPQEEWQGYVRAQAGESAAEAPQDAAETPIRLFDGEEGEDELSDTARRRGQTTRLFKTGTSATTRIHINETEEAVRRGEAARKAQARAEKRKQDAAAERRNKRKKRSTILKGLFANVAFVLFFIAAVLVALYYGFLLSDISVAGNNQYTSEQIIEASGLKRGTHMLLCNLEEAEAKIEENPYWQVDSIVYGFPNRIRIMITERKAVAGIAGLDYNVVIDDQGYVLSMPSDSGGLKGLLQVSGISMTGFRLGQRLGEGNDFGTATLIEIIGKLEEYELLDDIASIDLTRPLAITMRANSGLTLHVGQGTDLDNKMSALSKLLPRFTEQGITSGTLYLSAKGGAVYSPANAAANAQPIVTDGVDIVPPQDDPNFVDDDGDGLDDVTGEPRTTAVAPLPGATPLPTPSPTPYVPGGGADDFSG